MTARTPRVITRVLLGVVAGLAFSGMACVPPAPVASTPDIAATVEAAIKAALPTATPTPTPDIEATIEAGIKAGLETTPTAAPTFTPTAAPTPTPPPPETVANTSVPTATPTLAQMVQRVRPGVVRIDTGRGGGTGFIFETERSSTSALVLTNYHVVEGYVSVDVTVDDSSTYAGTVIGVDSIRDLAVVRICCGDFQDLDFVDASNLLPGTEVVAIGYPLGIPGRATITKGIVSAIRYDSVADRWEIQTDTPINPGNSGGPLLTSSGEVVGVNTYKVESTLGGRPVEGLGFAVAEQTVRHILPALRDGSRVGLPTFTPVPPPTLRPTSTPKPTATHTPIPKPTAPATWRTYTNPVHGYVIDVAPGWAIDDSNKDAVYFSPNRFAGLTVFAPRRVGNGASIDQIGDGNIDFRAKEPNILFALISRSEIAVAEGFDVAIIEFRRQDRSDYCVQNYKTMLLLVNQGGSRYHYELIGSVCDGFESNMPEIIQMQNLFAARLNEGR